MPYSLSQLNAMTQDEFTQALGAVFEDTPAIARQAWKQRPFASLEALHTALVEVVQALSPAEQLALLQAHPDLGSRVAMAAASVAEQANAGLNQLSSEEYDQFQILNRQYRDIFGFPFIMAVAGQTKTTILQTFAARARHDKATERAQALEQVCQIAWIRLQSWVTETE